MTGWNPRRVGSIEALGDVGLIVKDAASLNAASQQRLVLALDQATAAQERTNKRIERLEYVGIGLAGVGLP